MITQIKCAKIKFDIDECIDSLREFDPLALKILELESANAKVSFSDDMGVDWGVLTDPDLFIGLGPFNVIPIGKSFGPERVSYWYIRNAVKIGLDRALPGGIENQDTRTITFVTLLAELIYFYFSASDLPKEKAYQLFQKQMRIQCQLYEAILNEAFKLTNSIPPSTSPMLKAFAKYKSYEELRNRNSGGHLLNIIRLGKRPANKKQKTNYQNLTKLFYQSKSAGEYFKHIFKQVKVRQRSSARN